VFVDEKDFYRKLGVKIFFSDSTLVFLPVHQPCGVDITCFSYTVTLIYNNGSALVIVLKRFTNSAAAIIVQFISQNSITCPGGKWQLNANNSTRIGSGKSMAKTTPAGVPCHPLSIKPAGNFYTAENNLSLAAGYFFNLPDEVLVQTFEYLDATSLRRIATCKRLYAFSRLDDLWKRLFIG